jgi:hypothetical protein
MRPFRPFLCRHDFYWSERHGADRCRRCGAVQEGREGGAMGGGLAALLAADEELARPTSSSHAPEISSVFQNWDHDEPAPTPPAPPTGLSGASLLDRLDELIAGGELSRAQTIETLLAVIEDGQSSDPVVFGPSAATWFARLNSAR